MQFATFGSDKKPTLYAYENGYTGRFNETQWEMSNIGWMDILHEGMSMPGLLKNLSYTQAKEIFGDKEPEMFFSEIKSQQGI